MASMRRKRTRIGLAAALVLCVICVWAFRSAATQLSIEDWRAADMRERARIARMIVGADSIEAMSVGDVLHLLGTPSSHQLVYQVGGQPYDLLFVNFDAEQTVTTVHGWFDPRGGAGAFDSEQWRSEPSHARLTQASRLCSNAKSVLVGRDRGHCLAVLGEPTEESLSYVVGASGDSTFEICLRNGSVASTELRTD